MKNILITGPNRGPGLRFVHHYLDRGDRVWGKTDMTNQTETGLIDVDTSVAGLTSVIDNINDYSPGAFVAFDGTVIPY